MDPTTLDENDPIQDEDLPRLSSYSSASSASAISELSFEDPRNIDRNDPGSFALDYELSKRDQAQAEESGSDTSDDDPTVGSSSALESPPSQVMERTPNTSGYRIPSHVFARNKSNTPNPEWSTCSNESLFSIHNANMSFTRDQYNWMFKSGELGMYGPDMYKSGELDFAKVSDMYKSGELDFAKVSDMYKSGELLPPSPQIVQKSDETKIIDAELHAMRPQVIKSGEEVTPKHVKNSASSPQVLEVSKVSYVVEMPPRTSDATLDLGVTSKNEGSKRNDRKGEKLPEEEMRSSEASVSHHSNTSGQSFAFPMLGEMDREKSVNSRKSRTDRAKESSAKEEQNTPTSAPHKPTSASSSSWFSCFSRCSCC